MHDDLKTISQKPTQTFCEKPNNFGKPQIFNKKKKKKKKNQKLGQKREMQDEWVKMRHSRSKKCTQRPKNT